MRMRSLFSARVSSCLVFHIDVYFGIRTHDETPPHEQGGRVCVLSWRGVNIISGEALGMRQKS
jgi:hypothetical protein